MKPVDCPRRWEVEALEDGRLNGPDRAAFERHLALCAECKAERQGFESLREAMRHLPAPETSPIARLRLRASVLREANKRVVSVRHAPSVRWAATVLALVGAAGAAVAWNVRKAEVASTAAVSAPPKFEVISAPGVQWRSRTDGSVVTVSLDEGSASFSVHHLGAAQRFFVSLPDGEIEVRGTRFIVDVEEHQTRSVAVTEGRVALRRSGAPEVLLLAGDYWSNPPSVPRPIVDLRTIPLVDAGPRAVDGVPKSRAAPSSSASVGSALPTRGDRFDEAVASFKAEDYARADVQLQAFVRQFPDDPRAEDASFLRAVARWRTGDKDGAAQLARTYLVSYPSGLRRSEARRIIDGTAR
jgi:anti-sigma factor RsiW